MLGLLVGEAPALPLMVLLVVAVLLVIQLVAMIFEWCSGQPGKGSHVGRQGGAAVSNSDSLVERVAAVGSHVHAMYAHSCRVGCWAVTVGCTS